MYIRNIISLNTRQRAYSSHDSLRFLLLTRTFSLQLLCKLASSRLRHAPAVAARVFVLTKAMLFVFANLYALTASVSSVLHVLSYILSMLLFCLFMLGLFML